MFLRSPRFRHSVFSHSTGTAGFPRSVCPQQQPMQTETCPITRRFVVTGCQVLVIIGRLFRNYIPGGVYYPKDGGGDSWLTYYGTKRKCSIVSGAFAGKLSLLNTR